MDGEVWVSGLGGRDHVSTRVYATSQNGSLSGPVYLSDVGPDTAGDVDAKFSMPLSCNSGPLFQAEGWVGDDEPDWRRGSE
jgi:hypothetical protein